MDEDEFVHLPTHITYLAEARQKGITDALEGIHNFTDGGLHCICKHCRKDYATGYAVGVNMRMIWYD